MNSKKIVRCALVAALYAAVSLALAPFSFGPVQLRIGEALTLLPILTPDAIVGVTLGCFVTNLIGVFTGANLLGSLDVVFGTAATLAAALCTRYLRDVRLGRLPIASALAPVLFNAAVIGAELMWVVGPRTPSGLLLHAACVALGEAAACMLFGIPLVRYIEKTPSLNKLFE